MATPQPEVQAPASYVLCATPRSGSTLLCAMLAATGVAGRPNSYFRQEDVEDWADAWGVPHPRGIEDAEFDRAYLAAMRREGTADTDVFGRRFMGGSVADAARRLGRALGAERDVATNLEAAFGPVLCVHVSRGDKVAQAVSRVRAEQSGLWHGRADGTVLEGAASPRPVAYDGARLAALVTGLESDQAAWQTFFTQHGIDPLWLTYEKVAADPSAALARILAALGLDPAAAVSVPVPTARLADGESRRWVEQFRRESDP